MSNYIKSAAGSLLFVIPLTYLFIGEHIPFEFFDVWDMHGTGLMDWALVGLPPVIWGIVVTVAFCAYRGAPTIENPKLFLKGGILVSLWAGVTEEIAFRWILFYGSFLGAHILNFCFFGFLGFGFLEWFYLNVAGPVANFFTYGFLEEYLFMPEYWLVGSAILISNGFFRDGHKYQGLFGLVNSWFLGMYFFYVMFNYGLLAAILIHFMYDLVIFGSNLAISTLEKSYK